MANKSSWKLALALNDTGFVQAVVKKLTSIGCPGKRHIHYTAYCKFLLPFEVYALLPGILFVDKSMISPFGLLDF